MSAKEGADVAAMRKRLLAMGVTAVRRDPARFKQDVAATHARLEATTTPERKGRGQSPRSPRQRVVTPDLSPQLSAAVPTEEAVDWPAVQRHQRGRLRREFRESLRDTRARLKRHPTALVDGAERAAERRAEFTRGLESTLTELHRRRVAFRHRPRRPPLAHAHAAKRRRAPPPPAAGGRAATETALQEYRGVRVTEPARDHFHKRRVSVPQSRGAVAVSAVGTKPSAAIGASEVSGLADDAESRLPPRVRALWFQGKGSDRGARSASAGGTDHTGLSATLHAAPAPLSASLNMTGTASLWAAESAGGSRGGSRHGRTFTAGHSLLATDSSLVRMGAQPVRHERHPAFRTPQETFDLWSTYGTRRPPHRAVPHPLRPPPDAVAKGRELVRDVRAPPDGDVAAHVAAMRKNASIELLRSDTRSGPGARLGGTSASRLTRR